MVMVRPSSAPRVRVSAPALVMVSRQMRVEKVLSVLFSMEG